MTILANWRHHLTPAGYDEGLGLVYERFVLNDFLLELQGRYHFRSVLEAPLFGMAGVSGINSVGLAQAGCEVTLVDDNEERAAGVQRIWQELGLPVRVIRHDDFGALPFADASFDFVWEWAGLWFLKNPAGLLREMARISRRLVFVAMPNRAQVGYLLRKYLLDKAFFREVDEGWADMGRIRRVLTGAGLRIIGQGVLDVPPWPDTVMPAAEVLRRLGIRSRRREQRVTGDGWRWSTMAYYLGQQPDLRERVLRYAWLDRARLPWQVKAVWAHHRYLLAEK
jgi:hypothetical protein